MADSLDIANSFEAALAKDANTNLPPELPPPPRKPERDPEAPHGRDENGEPLAPHGRKADGTPRLRPAGPGRPAAEKPRVTSAPPHSAGKSGKVDYAPGLVQFGEMVWLAASLSPDLKFGKRKDKDGNVKPLINLSDTGAYACVFRQQLPLLASTWSEAANQNDTVRRVVSKIAGGSSGEGVSWIFGVGLSSAIFFMGCKQLAAAENSELRKNLAAKNSVDVKQFMQGMLEKMGMSE